MKVLWMAPGEAGDLGPSVLVAVVEEPKPGGDSVTVQPTVADTVRGITLSRGPATLTHVSYLVRKF